MRMSETRDSLCTYLSSRLLAEKRSPYNDGLLEKAWDELRNQPNNALIPTFTSVVYPPTTLALLSLFSRLSWNHFRYLLLAVDTVGLIAVLIVLSRSLGGRLNSQLSLWLWVIGFSWAPWHSGMATGNLSIPAISLGVMGWWAGESRRDWLASGFLLLSLMVKPQTGLVFLVILAFRRYWKPVYVSLICWIVILAATVLWMQRFIPAWWHDYQAMVGVFLAAGRANDPSSGNPLRHDLINLQRLLYPIFDNGALANALALLLIGLLTLLLVTWHRNREVHITPLLTSATIVTIGLLPFYHRFYDASIMLFAVAWAISHWKSGAAIKRCAAGVLAGCVPFLVPGAAALALAVNHGFVPDVVVKARWWEVFVMSHQVWALLWVAGWLSYAMMVEANKEQERVCG